MKIGVSSYSFSKYMNQTKADYFTICDLAKKMGYDAIEFIDLSLEVQPAESLTELAKAIHRHCEEIDLPIAAYTVSADFLRPNEVQTVMEKVDIAETLGAKVLRHDASWSLPEGMDWRQLIDQIAPDIRRVTEYAAEKGHPYLHRKSRLRSAGRRASRNADPHSEPPQLRLAGGHGQFSMRR